MTLSEINNPRNVFKLVSFISTEIVYYLDSLMRQERTDSGLSNYTVSVTAVVLSSEARDGDKDKKLKRFGGGI